VPSELAPAEPLLADADADAVSNAEAVPAVGASADQTEEIPPAPPSAPPGKETGKTRAPDRVFLPHAKDAIAIRPNTAEMFVLQHLRDEAHRFAITFHRQQRKRLTLRSALSTIPGIGLGRQRLLLRHFGSLKKIRESSLEDLVAVPGMTRKAAGAVYAHWKKQPLPADDSGAAAGMATATSRPPAPAEADEDAVDSAFADLEADADSEAEAEKLE
jgi:excinuclease ABC subunit C